MVLFNEMFKSYNSFILLAVPFFLLTANLMNSGGITERLMRLSRALVGHFPGGLAQINVILSVFFAGISGSSTADAASQGSVTAKLIENRPALRTGELLEFVPGMIVTQHSGDGKANQYFLRGFNLDHGTDFAMSLEGMPLNMRTHAHGQGYTDLNFLIPELVDRINYKKGPYYADEGEKVFHPLRTFLDKQGLKATFLSKTGHIADTIAATASERES